MTRKVIFFFATCCFIISKTVEARPQFQGGFNIDPLQLNNFSPNVKSDIIEAKPIINLLDPNNNQVLHSQTELELPPSFIPMVTNYFSPWTLWPYLNPQMFSNLNQDGFPNDQTVPLVNVVPNALPNTNFNENSSDDKQNFKMDFPFQVSDEVEGNGTDEIKTQSTISNSSNTMVDMQRSSPSVIIQNDSKKEIGDRVKRQVLQDPNPADVFSTNINNGVFLGDNANYDTDINDPNSNPETIPVDYPDYKNY